MSPRGESRGETTVASIAAAILLALVAVPLGLVGIELVLEGGAATVEAELGAPRPWLLLLETVGSSIGTTAVALAIGVPLGALLGATNVAGRGLASLVHGFPLFLPPFIVALGWFHVFGRGGWLGGDATATLFFGPAGLIGCLGLTFSPVVTGLTILGLRGIDPSLGEAARMVARAPRVLTRILLPQASSAIALSALIVFALSLSEIGVPMFLRTRTYSAVVFSRLAGVGHAPGEAFALALPLLAVGAVLLVAERRVSGRRAVASLGLRSGEWHALPLGPLRWPLTVSCWLVTAASVLPILALAATATHATLADLHRWTGASAVNSLLTGAGAATLVTMLGTVLGWRLARGRPGARWLDALALWAFITPAAVLGLGLVAAWNRPLTHAVYSSIGILVIGLAARYAVIGTRGAAVVLSQSSTRYEIAAQVAGAGYVRRMARIVVPMHARGLAGVWLLSLVFCLRDLETIVIFYPPGRATLPIRVFTLEANGPHEIVAGLATVHVGMTAIALALGTTLLLRARRSA